MEIPNAVAQLRNSRDTERYGERHSLVSDRYPIRQHASVLAQQAARSGGHIGGAQPPVLHAALAALGMLAIRPVRLEARCG
ncbi:MAG: hypothetical protein KIT71_11925 [Nitrospira sp.]|nr:hypothetical protein [Nitrospira sp.]MCW5780186.1 hypothetical protein [Nitrospira sp.]